MAAMDWTIQVRNFIWVFLKDNRGQALVIFSFFPVTLAETWIVSGAAPTQTFMHACVAGGGLISHDIALALLTLPLHKSLTFSSLFLGSINLHGLDISCKLNYKTCTFFLCLAPCTQCYVQVIYIVVYMSSPFLKG